LRSAATSLQNVEDALSLSSLDDGFDLDMRPGSLLTESVAIIACLVAGLLVYFAMHVPTPARHRPKTQMSPTALALKKGATVQSSLVHVPGGRAAVAWPLGGHDQR
jgi:hypothetical protein